eukprot:Opistho-1_new@83995
MSRHDDYGAWGAAASSQRGPASVDPVQAAQNSVAEFNNAVNTMRKLVDVLGTPKDTASFRSQLRDQRTKTTSLARSTKQIMDNKPYTLDEPNRLKWEKLARQFTTCIKDFEDISKLSLQKERQIIARTQSMSEGQGGAGGGGGGSAGGWGQQQQQQQVSHQEFARQEQTLIDLEEQNREIRQLESDLVQLHECFVDMQRLVTEQGETIDSIERHTETAAMSTEVAVQEVKQAQSYQSAARRKKIACIVIVIVALIVGAIVVYFIVKK